MKTLSFAIVASLLGLTALASPESYGPTAYFYDCVEAVKMFGVVGGTPSTLLPEAKQAIRDSKISSINASLSDTTLSVRYSRNELNCSEPNNCNRAPKSSLLFVGSKADLDSSTTKATKGEDRVIRGLIMSAVATRGSDTFACAEKSPGDVAIQLREFGLPFVAAAKRSPRTFNKSMSKSELDPAGKNPK